MQLCETPVAIKSEYETLTITRDMDRDERNSLVPSTAPVLYSTTSFKILPAHPHFVLYRCFYTCACATEHLSGYLEQSEVFEDSS